MAAGEKWDYVDQEASSQHTQRNWLYGWPQPSLAAGGRGHFCYLIASLALLHCSIVLGCNQNSFLYTSHIGNIGTLATTGHWSHHPTVASSQYLDICPRHPMLHPAATFHATINIRFQLDINQLTIVSVWEQWWCSEKSIYIIIILCLLDTNIRV